MAVIQRTEYLIQGTVKYLLLIMVLIIIGDGDGQKKSYVLAIPQGCNSIQDDVIAKGFDANLILDRPIIGPICNSETCCSRELQENMQIVSQIQIEKFVKDSIIKVSSMIDSRARKFDEFFREMMNVSKREFHEMFERTYGKLYLQNAHLFSDFFNELDTYYKKGTIRLSDTLDSFFAILYQRMFTVINSQYHLDEKYLECVSNNMVQMNPFGDVPHKLSVQLRRSFVATRTFYKSLMKASQVAMNLINLKMGTDCYQELTRMQYCSICDGSLRHYNNIKDTTACSTYCTNTLQMCLKYFIEFSPIWDTFVDAIEKVAERLLGPYNIEVVVEPLNIKISEAIMNFQEARTEVSNKIYSICGKPELARVKRKAEYSNNMNSTKNVELKQETLHKRINIGKKKNKKVEKIPVDNTPTLEKLITDIKLKVKDTKRFWIQLPYQYCNNQSISAPPSHSTCWNGTAFSLYNNMHQVDLKTNRRESPIIIEQIYILQGLTDKLKKAHQGQEVEFFDDSDELLAGSGSASGCGIDDEDCIIDENNNVNTNKNNGDSYNDDIEDDLELTNNKGKVNIIVDSNDLATSSSSSSTEIPPNVIGGTSSKAAPTPQRSSMSLTKAFVHFVVPIVLAWFGGAISDLL